MWEKVHHESNIRDLSTVAIVDFSSAPEISLHSQSLITHKGVIVPTTDIETISGMTQQKIAVIVDQSMWNHDLEKLITLSDSFIEENPDMSLRIFYLRWSHAIPAISWWRLRVIDANKVAPYDLPIHINRSLYKARLPYFLRQGYDIEISHDLQNINGENYRPITIKKHLQSEIDSAADYSDTTHYIFAKDNRIQRMYQVTENGRLEPCEWDEKKNTPSKYGQYNR